MKKLLAAILTLALLISLIPMAMADEEPITLTYFYGAPGDQPYPDNKIYKKIEEEFGITFEMEFLAGDLDEKLGMMCQDPDDLPDLFDGHYPSDHLPVVAKVIL